MCKIMKKMMVVSLITALLVNVAGIPAHAASKTQWKKLYASHLNAMKDFEKIYPNGEFIYVNHDNIPELYLQGYCNGAGSCLLTIYKNKVYEYKLVQPGDFSYLKKQNQFHIAAGRDGDRWEYVAKFSEGKVIGLAGGVFGFDVFQDGDIRLDKEEKPIYHYYWNAKSKKGGNLDEYYQNAKNGRKLTNRAYDKKRNQALGKDRTKYRFVLSKKSIRQIKKKLKM